MGNGRGPGRTTAPGPTTQTVSSHTDEDERTGEVRQDRSLRLAIDELEGVAELVHAARLTAKAGHRPVVHVRRAAVRLAALDAALTDGPSS